MSYGMDFQGDAGGGGGGGFTNNDNSFSGGGTQDSAEKKSRRSYDDQTLIPVTISMAMKAQSDVAGGDGTMVLEDGRSLHMIKLIGAVRSVDTQSTNILYVIEDGTGVCDVKQWVDDNEPAAVTELTKAAAIENVYVKVIGMIKEYEGRKQIVATSVQRVLSGNELTHHLLEVMYSAEKFKQADSIVPPIMNMQNNNNNSMGYNNSSSSGQGAEIGNGFGGGGDPVEINKNNILEVFKRLNDEASETGTSVQQCIAELPSMSEADVRDAINFLSEEGQLYSTIDEHHFKFAY